MAWSSSSLLPAIKVPASRNAKWWLIDAGGHRVGRLATQIVRLLQGKHKRTYNPMVLCGDYVVVINARHVEFSGKKWFHKYYRWHTGYRLKEVQAKEMLFNKPENIMKKAVMGMLRKNKLKFQMQNRLLVYPDDEHPHAAQKPEVHIPDKTINDTVLPAFDYSEEFTIGLERQEDGTLKLWDEIDRVFTREQWRAVKKAKKEGRLGLSHRPKVMPKKYEGYVMSSQFEDAQQQSLVRTLKKYGKYNPPPKTDNREDPVQFDILPEEPGIEWTTFPKKGGRAPKL